MVLQLFFRGQNLSNLKSQDVIKGFREFL